MKLIFCESRGCNKLLFSKIFPELGTYWRFAASGDWAVASPSRPISSIAPGCVMTKLCGIKSRLLKMNSTGLPARSAEGVKVARHTIPVPGVAQVFRPLHKKCAPANQNQQKSRPLQQIGDPQKFM